MANTPTPRSYNQILGAMISAFLARFPIRNLKVGGPILAIMEAAAQSDFRNTADTFTSLASTSLASADEAGVTQILEDEGTEWQGAKASTGYVSITDTRYTKKSSFIYSGKPAPLSGSTTIYVADATGWAASGQIYIGRGTANYEGPLSYTALVNSGSYWTVTLSGLTPTTRYHNLNESVIVAQGGDRTIAAGTLVQTAQGNVASAVQFSTLYTATIPDGEVTVDNVQVTCTKPGKLGNVPAGAITQFTSAPFNGATPDNPLPLTNGVEAETLEEAKTRIRKLRQSRVRGTDLAIETLLLGSIAQDENKRISSVKVVHRQDYPTTTYIDDGTGYEEIFQGVPYELLTSSAVGGEEYFQLSLGRPVTKACIQTTFQEPFALVANSILTVLVGGTQYQHTFPDTDFRSIGNAAAYEVSHSINSNPNIGFSARLSDNGTRVTIFAKGDTNEDIQVTSVAPDANSKLGFPTNLVESSRLYKNDVLLSKDGRAAAIVSNAQASWLAMTSPETITVNVDGTGAVTYSITSADFVTAGTGYLTLSQNNSLASWATVLNYKIPGITVTVSGNQLVMTSNAGPVTRGSLAITGGTLVSKAMFAATSVTASAKDYTLDRNLGQLHLTSALVAGDKLSAGSPYTRGFLESSFISGTLAVPAGSYWFVVDGNPSMITVPFSGTTLFTETASVVGGRPDYILLDSNGTAIFNNVLAGDCVILWDSTFANPGAHRVAQVVSNTQLLLTSNGVGIVAQPVPTALASGGLTVVRTDAFVQLVSEPGTAAYTAQSLATFFNTRIKGATASVVRTGHFRITTNTAGSNGDITLVARTAGLSGVPLTVGSTKKSSTSHLAYAEAGNADVDYPIFQVGLTALGAAMTFNFTQVTPNLGDLGDLYTTIKTIPYSLGSLPAWGANVNFTTPSIATTGGGAPVLTFRSTPADNRWNTGDRLYEARPYAIGPLDDLSVVLDNDINSKRFDIRVSRKLNTAIGSYNTTFLAGDADNNNLGLDKAFGNGFSFNDYAVYMHARMLTDAATTKEILWRWKNMGKDGERVALRYDIPLAPSQTANYSIDPFTTQTPKVSILLPSGAARNLANMTATVHIGDTSFGPIGGGNTPTRFYLVTGLQVTQYQMTAGVVTLLLAPPAASGFTNHGLLAGNVVSVTYAGGVPLAPAPGVTLTGIPGALQIQYTVAPPPPDQPLSAVGAWGWVYFDSIPGADWTGVVAGDGLVINAAAGLRAEVTGKGLYVEGIVAGFNNQAITVLAAENVIAETTMRWPTTPLGSVTYLKDFPIGGTAATIVTQINALADAPLTAVGAGVGVINEPTWKTASDITQYYPFLDGLNFVHTTNQPGGPNTDYQFQMKYTATASLVGHATWTTEEVYLVPLSSDNCAGFLGALATNGLSANGEVIVSSRARKLQISTATQGSIGTVNVRGGTANSATANVNGTAGLTVDTLSAYVVVPTAEISGFHASWYTRIQNTLPIFKSNGVSTANLTSIVGTLWTFGAAIGTYFINTNVPVQVEKWGKYTAIMWTGAGAAPNFGGCQAGDYVRISKQGGDTVSTNNTGNFIVIAIDVTNKIVWIENSNAAPEMCVASITFATRDSVWYGDKLIVGTAAWGANNQGKTFTIADIPSATTFDTVETPQASGAVAGPQPLVQLQAGVVHKFVKRIRTIVPYPSNANLSIVVFEDPSAYQAISAVYGSQLQAAGKLEFTVGITTGIDGYAYSTGLIGEANRVLYGDENDPITYPGVVSAGANVNISGPIVRRIQVALILRVRQGMSKATVFDAVRSAVASFINDQGVGQSIAISDIVAVANAVGGVDAVAVASPTYSSSSDLIAVQPYEKPMVLQPEQDITLTLA